MYRHGVVLTSANTWSLSVAASSFQFASVRPSLSCQYLLESLGAPGWTRDSSEVCRAETVMAFENQNRSHLWLTFSLGLFVHLAFKSQSPLSFAASDIFPC